MARSVTLEDGTKAYAFGRDGLYVASPERAGKRYRVSGYDGIAFYVAGAIVEPTEVYDDETGEHVGYDYCPSGSLACVMVGDDRIHAVEGDEVAEIGENDYCHECGQIGCKHDGR